MKKFLFVCLGNICRSPAAEGVFKDLLNKESIADQFFVDSCGTSNAHAGEKADSRMRASASNRGIELTSISRGFRDEDFEKFDFIVTMDNSNYFNIMARLPSEEYEKKILKMADFVIKQDFDEVPDPYYGGQGGFELVLNILEEGSINLLKKIMEEEKA